MSTLIRVVDNVLSKKRNDMKDEIFKVAKNHTENEETAMQLTNELCVLLGVSHSNTLNYLDDKYEVKWLINNTYQVEQNGNCVYQGSESDCNEWLKCQLGYCG